MYRTTAHDPELGIPRVYGEADNPAQAKINCLAELCKYLQNTQRWAEMGEFGLETHKI